MRQHTTRLLFKITENIQSKVSPRIRHITVHLKGKDTCHTCLFFYLPFQGSQEALTGLQTAFSQEMHLLLNSQKNKSNQTIKKSVIIFWFVYRTGKGIQQSTILYNTGRDLFKSSTALQLPLSLLKLKIWNHFRLRQIAQHIRRQNSQKNAASHTNSIFLIPLFFDKDYFIASYETVVL